MSTIQGPGPNPVQAPEHVHALLNRLHQLSIDQEKHIDRSEYTKDTMHDFMRDKFIALDQDKAQFVYQLCRAIHATNVVEIGTSFGVSTIYLALAVGQAGKGKVIATENEPTKAAQARAYWHEAGEEVEKYIELRQGDVRDTLKQGLPQVDLVLLDIWTPMAKPSLQLVQPHLRSGAVIIVDNIDGARAGYKDLIAYMEADTRFSRLTVPYAKGLEMCLYHT